MSKSRWVFEDEPEEEKLSSSEKIQPGRFVFEDEPKSGASNSQDEGFFQKLPRNILGGIAGMGQSALNYPHDIAQNLEGQLNNFRGLVNKSFPLEKYGVNELRNTNYADSIPAQNENNLNAYKQMLGQHGEPTFADTLIQKGVEHSPELLSAGNALRNIIPHLTRRGAAKKLNAAQHLGNERQMGSLNVNPELIEDTRQFLPNTIPYRNAIQEAKKGNYKELFNLQSDLGKHSASSAKSMFSAAERMHGKAGLETRNSLLEDIHRNLQAQGHHDISELLREGQKDYRRYMKFKPYRNALIATGAALALPKNIFMDLMKKIILKKNSD